MEIDPDAVATIAFPLMSILETLLAVPTNTPSSNIEIPPTNFTGGISCQ